MKITKSELQEVILQEVKKLERIDMLKGKLKLINEALEHPENLNEEEIEELFGGLRKVFQKGGQKVADTAKDAAGAVAGGVKDAAGSVKQTYQAGEKEATKNKNQARLSKLKSTIDSAQQQYKQLSGKSYAGGAVAGPIVAEGAEKK